MASIICVIDLVRCTWPILLAAVCDPRGLWRLALDGRWVPDSARQAELDEPEIR